MPQSDKAQFSAGNVNGLIYFQGEEVEVRAGIEPTYADLQSATSPFCHRTNGVWMKALCPFLSNWSSRCVVPILKQYARQTLKTHGRHRSVGQMANAGEYAT